MFSQKVVQNLKNSSFIRAMFEEGEKLRKIHGADNVFDFSIGNPEIEPPAAFSCKLLSLVQDETPGMHRYMSNSGYESAREAVSHSISKDSGIKFKASEIVMTCGAAGGLNVVLKALLDPGDEVIVFAPYFVEYFFYIDNHGGTPVTVPVNKDTFLIDELILEKYITPKTKAIIINSPNNPTGTVYPESTLKMVAGLLETKEKQYGTSIYVISDEPYSKITYDNILVPNIMKIFKNAISVNSYSKSLALPGERIGYIAVNPSIEDSETLMNCLSFANRTLGFVNAPALMQRAVSVCLDEKIDMKDYTEKRDILYNHLISLGFECKKPEGAFYLFPKALIEDDAGFVKAAMNHKLLIVPGRGFGWPGYFRIAFSVSMNTVRNSLPAFAKLAAEFK